MLTPPPDRYRPDPEAGRVRTLLFATIPPNYYADRAEWFAAQGIDGVMLHGPMHNWDSDVWALPDGKRIVGRDNPDFQTCKRMNDRCREAGIRFNSVKVAFYKPLPDWFDDEGWRGLCGNFRQCAVFARDAGFAGIALDIEYIAQIYELTYPAYLAPDYPRERLREQARRRGEEMMAAMLGEFPDMVNWHLPEGMHYYGPLATDLTVGMLRACAKADAPGGFHVCTEGTYTRTGPEWIVRYLSSIDDQIAGACDEKARAYWLRRGTISPGLWPLGYYRDILDENGKRIGYSGRKETFGDALVGSYSDKSENYSPEEFRRQCAAARMTAGRFLWIYCHGSVLYQMTEEESERYGGGKSDVLPIVRNLDEYLAVLKDRRVFDDAAFSSITAAVRERKPIDLLAGRGIPRKWWHVGPFPNADGKELDTAYPPEERKVDISVSYVGAHGLVSWREAPVDALGFVNLRRIIAREDEDYVFSYSVAWLESAATLKAFIRFGSEDGAKIWVNEKLVHRIDTVRGAVEDKDLIPVDLPVGRVQILVKCGNPRGRWGFYLRITDGAGNELDGLRFEV